jgi:hypothetical protein
MGVMHVFIHYGIIDNSGFSAGEWPLKPSILQNESFRYMLITENYRYIRPGHTVEIIHSGKPKTSSVGSNLT